MRKRFILFNDPDFLVGRKAICGYLGMSWRTVLRWKKNYGMESLFMRSMNGDPILIKSSFEKWIFLCDETLKRHNSRLVSEPVTKDGQAINNSDIDVMQTSPEK